MKYFSWRQNLFHGDKHVHIFWCCFCVTTAHSSAVIIIIEGIKNMIKMRRQEQCETRTTRMLSHLSSDEEYYTADEEINDIDQWLSLIYPNHIRFIIGYISLWSENVSRSNCTKLYHEYLTWCKTNNRKPFHRTILGKKLSEISISQMQVRIGDGKREW